MPWTEFVIDASADRGDGPLCVIPVEGWPDAPVFVTGMNYLGMVPRGGKIVGIIHEDGQGAVDAWFGRNEDRCKALAARPWASQ